MDILEEVDIGSEDRSRPTFISTKLDLDRKASLITLLKEYKDYFLWEYHEMPGLSRSLVEHQLPINEGYRPFKQPPRQFHPRTHEAIKAEIARLYDVGFIRPCRYAQWISNIVPVAKKNGKLCVCIDFRDLNKATPKEKYPMLVADMLVDAASGHKVITFMDGNAGYNQIFMAEEDIPMMFGLKNAGDTYQRAMNYIFHDLIGQLVEVYIDDIMIKLKSEDTHLADLRKVLERTRQYGLRMNPNKCAFGVTAGQFLGFMVHERGIEVSQQCIKAINDTGPPTNKITLQSLVGKINFLRRFISNLSGRLEPFTPLLWLKPHEEFRWG